MKLKRFNNLNEGLIGLMNLDINNIKLKPSGKLPISILFPKINIFILYGSKNDPDARIIEIDTSENTLAEYVGWDEYYDEYGHYPNLDELKDFEKKFESYYDQLCDIFQGPAGSVQHILYDEL